MVTACQSRARGAPTAGGTDPSTSRGRQLVGDRVGERPYAGVAQHGGWDLRAQSVDDERQVDGHRSSTIGSVPGVAVQLEDATTMARTVGPAS